MVSLICGNEKKKIQIYLFIKQNQTQKKKTNLLPKRKE